MDIKNVTLVEFPTYRKCFVRYANGVTMEYTGSTTPKRVVEFVNDCETEKAYQKMESFGVIVTIYEK